MNCERKKERFLLAQKSILDENAMTFQYLTKANGTSEWMWSIYFKYVAISVSNMVVSCLLSVFYFNFILRIESTDNYYRPLKYL